MWWIVVGLLLLWPWSTSNAQSPYSLLFSVPAQIARISAMTTDAAGNIYLTGFARADGLPTTPGALRPHFTASTCVGINPGPIDPSIFPCPDAFVIKLDPSGRVIYATYLGGTGSDSGTGIAVDAAGNAYIAGRTTTNRSPNTFPTTLGAAFTAFPTNGVSGFLAKLNQTGTALLYSTLLPGSWDAVAVAIDASSGAAYVVGTALYPDFPATAGAFQTVKRGASYTPFVAKINASGSALVYGTYLGGSAYNINGLNGDHGLAIAVDGAGNVVVGGGTDSLDFPVTPGAFQTSFGGLPFVPTF